MSIVDYINASSNLFEIFSSFSVDDYDISDHFPLKCSLRLLLRTHSGDVARNDRINDWHKYKWNESFRDDFLHKFNFYYSEFRNKLLQNEHELSFYLQDFVKVFQVSGDIMEVNYNRSRNCDNVQQSLWWDPAYDKAKSLKYKLLRKFRLTNAQDDFISYKMQRKWFKALCKLKKNKFQQKCRSALIDTKDNPKLIWQTIKDNSSLKHKTDNAIQSGEPDVEGERILEYALAFDLLLGTHVSRNVTAT